jgi:alcohol dehydrogenase
MKAAQISEYGAPTNITINEVDIPTPGATQVLVSVSSAGLNPYDAIVLAGYAHAMAPLNFPATLGLDFAGTVTQVGSEVTEFTEGDHVYGTANAMFGASGAFAEYAVANTSSIALAPTTISSAESASLPTAGVSAWQGLVSELNIQSGQKVFINGGTGGVGSIAIQIAKHLGAYVAVTASADNADYAKSLGADEVIDYKTTDFKDVLHDYDAVLNNVRSDDASDSLKVLKKGGKGASLTGGYETEDAEALGVTAVNQMTHVTTASLDALREIVDAGAVKPAIDKSFLLNDVQKAYETLASSSVAGKIVITISE